MRILLFKPYTMLEGAGNKIWFFKIIPELKKLGYEFTIMDTDLGPKNIELKKIDDFCKKYKVEYTSLRTIKGLRLLTPSSLLKLCLAAKDSDLIYYVTADAAFDVPFWLLSYFKPVIGGWHTPLYFKNRLHNLYQRYLKLFFAKHFVNNHMVNPAAIKVVKRLGLKKATFIAHGVELDKFKPVKNKWRNDKFIILFVGRFEQQKGFDILLEGLTIFLDKIKDGNIEVQLIGGGSLQRLINSVDDERVHPIGFADNPARYYARAHVFIFPSRQEPWGHVALEAMSSGCLLIASQTEGPLYIVGNSETGWFLEELTGKEVATKLIFVYNLFQQRKEDLQRIGNAARARIEDEFSLKNHIKKLDAFFCLNYDKSI